MRALILLPILAACGPQRFYEGPRLPADEVTLVIVDDGRIDDSRRFVAKLTRLDTLPLRNPPKKFEVLPGEHSIEFVWMLETLAPGPGKAWLRTAMSTETITLSAAGGETVRLVWGTDRPELKADPAE